MKPKHQRLVFVAVSMVFLCVSALLILRAFRDNLVFFYSPSEIARQEIPLGRPVRVGGLVAPGSVVHDEQDRISFTITDNAAALAVTYEGMLPDLFREGQGVVAEGYLNKDKTRLNATTILAKHDESYMPREVVDALKRSGHWKGEVAQ